MVAHQAAVRRQVLIVEDNADAAWMLSAFISAHGHETAVAHCGADALAIAPVFDPEVVFLDLGMPEMSGYDVAQALRRIPSLSHVYIAALTGWNDEATRERVASTGFDKHLTKPADVGVVMKLVDQGAS